MTGRRASASCAVVGDGATAMARTALRRGGGGAGLLLVLGGHPPRGRRPVALRRGVARAVATLRSSIDPGWLVWGDGRLVCASVPAESVGDAAVADLLATYDGPVALAVEVPREDAVDRLLRSVDEIVLIEPSLPAARALALEGLSALGPVGVVAPGPQRVWRAWRQGSPAAPSGGEREGAPTALFGSDQGQSTITLLVAIALALAIAGALATVAAALGRGASEQGRADVAALAGARALLDAQPLLYSADPARQISSIEYRRRAVNAAQANALANGLKSPRIEVLGDPQLPNRVRVTARKSGTRVGPGSATVYAVAEVAVSVGATELASGGGYSGPLATRQGRQMRPDVALAFDRMQAAAQGAGITLVIVSAFRSDAEQARLFAAHPDPKWVAPPGKSLHRLGTELDLGPAGAYGWLAANAGRFGFLKRYAWEPWHFGFTRSAGSASVGYSGSAAGSARSGGGGERSGSAIPSFIPAAYAGLIAKAAQRWSIGAALLGAQLQVESGFNPRLVSPAGAAGIAQFMPATAAAYGLTPAERFDPAKAIDAQAHHMHDLMRQFASVPLALAAYNAGPRPVTSCMCVPPYRETQAYVQKILAILGGAGVGAPAGFEIRLVE